MHAFELVKRTVTSLADRRLVGRAVGEWHIDGVAGFGRYGTCFRASRLTAAAAGRGDARTAATEGAGSGGSGAGSGENASGGGEPVERAVLKLVKPAGGRQNRSLVDAAWQEEAALSLCDHSALPVWLGVVRDGNRLFMAQSLMPGASLHHLLAQGRTFTAQQIARLGTQLIDAAAHLHSRGVCHNDIRPANVLLSDEGRVSLVDFGLATFFDRRRADAEFAASSYADRAGIADTLLFLLYACPAVARGSASGGSQRRRAPWRPDVPWHEDLALPSAQREFLLDLFERECAFGSYEHVAAAFAAAFSA